MRRIIAIIDSHFSRNGLFLIFAAGKSEVLFFFRGKNASLTNKYLYHDLGKITCFKNDLGKDKQLLASDRYKNLGSTIVLSSSMLPEIVIRCSSMQGAYKDIRPTILSNDKIELKRKGTMIQSYLLSKGFYNAGTWRILNLS